MLNKQQSVLKSHNSTFLSKLQAILESPDLHPIIRWNSKGTAICVTCISRLQEQVLPLYFRHSKYTSFVRQLNIYGFSKCKSEKGVMAAFSHPLFVQGSKNLDKIQKRARKDQSKVKEKQLVQENLADEQRQFPEKNSHHTEHNTFQVQLISAGKQIPKCIEQGPISLKNSENLIYQPSSSIDQVPQYPSLNQNSLFESDLQNSPSVSQLIQELDSRMQAYKYQLDILKLIEMQRLLQESRYEKVRSLYQNRCQMEIKNNYLDLWGQPILDISHWSSYGSQEQQGEQMGMQFII